jgi:hypothetical protein
MNEINDNNENDIKVFQQKAQYFLENNTITFVKTKSFIFYKGIIKWVGADFFIIKDGEMGDSPIFYSEIISLNPSKTKRGKI